jgi:STE24 endopeptidase
MRDCARVFTLLCLLLVIASAAFAQEAGIEPATKMPSVLTVPPEAQPSANFNVDAATDAYLAQIPADARSRSDAYFEGGYWMLLWDFLYGAVVALILLNFRWSAKMRDWAERFTSSRNVHTFIYWIEYLILTTILLFPLTVYEGFFREHKYGLATQTFGPWLNDQFKDMLVTLVIGGIAVVVLFAIVRRLPNTWWIWGAVVSVVFNAVLGLIAPVLIFPIFNKITKLDDPKVTAPILSLARANGIPAKEVYQIDASKQTTRMSANVSGLGSTMRITMNDNLLKRGSPEEIQSVMGHEMGHYVLSHVYVGVLLFDPIMFVLFFGLLKLALDKCLARWGDKWRISDIGDPAVLPLVILLASIYFFLLTPVQNSFVRMQEHSADMYGLNATRQPDGFAQAAIHLGEYRKMSPGPIEEIIFYDHPSGRRRIHDAMQWKSENLKP